MGHQLIGVCEGYQVMRTQWQAHGSTRHMRFLKGSGFEDLQGSVLDKKKEAASETGLLFGTYHSLCLKEPPSTEHPRDLQVIAYDHLGEIAALGRFKTVQKEGLLPILTLQFHPESFLSQCGGQLMERWIALMMAGY